MLKADPKDPVKFQGAVQKVLKRQDNMVPLMTRASQMHRAKPLSPGKTLESETPQLAPEMSGKKKNGTGRVANWGLVPVWD